MYGVIGKAKQTSSTMKNLSMLVLINKSKGYLKFVKIMNVFNDKFNDVEAELDEVEQYVPEQEGIEG